MTEKKKKSQASPKKVPLHSWGALAEIHQKSNTCSRGHRIVDIVLGESQKTPQAVPDTLLGDRVLQADNALQEVQKWGELGVGEPVQVLHDHVDLQECTTERASWGGFSKSIHHKKGVTDRESCEL